MYCDRLLTEGKFDELNSTLKEVNTTNIAILVAWLGITCVEKDKLPERKRLIELIKTLEPSRAERLLKGLE